MVNCAVYCCPMYSQKTKGKDIIYHVFPHDLLLQKIWLLKCGRKDAVNVKYARVCSQHFTKDDYVRDLMNELLGIPLRKKKLKPTAVPSLNLAPENMTENSSNARKKSSDNGTNTSLQKLKSDEGKMIAANQHNECESKILCANFSCETVKQDKLKRKNPKCLSRKSSAHNIKKTGSSDTEINPSTKPSKLGTCNMYSLDKFTENEVNVSTANSCENRDSEKQKRKVKINQTIAVRRSLRSNAYIMRKPALVSSKSVMLNERRISLGHSCQKSAKPDPKLQVKVKFLTAEVRRLNLLCNKLKLKNRHLEKKLLSTQKQLYKNKEQSDKVVEEMSLIIKTYCKE